MEENQHHEFDMSNPSTAGDLAKLILNETVPSEVRRELLFNITQGIKVSALAIAFTCPEDHLEECDGSDCPANGDHTPWGILRALAEQMEAAGTSMGIEWEQTYAQFLEFRTLDDLANMAETGVPEDFSPEDIIGGGESNEEDSEPTL